MNDTRQELTEAGAEVRVSEAISDWFYPDEFDGDALADSIVRALVPTVEGLLAAATTEGRRQGIQVGRATADHQFWSQPGRGNAVAMTPCDLCGEKFADHWVARGGSAGQEHPQP